MAFGASAAAIWAGVGATAAVGSAVYAGHQGQMAKKEVNRQKSIAAEQMRVQGEEVAKQESLAAAESKALQDEIIRKQRASHEAVAGETLKRKTRGRRGLFSGSETGVNDPFSDTLG